MIRVSQVLAVLLLLTTAACHREGSSSGVASVVAAPKGAVVAPAARPSPRVATARADAGPDEAEVVRAAVRSWSDALDRHDARALLSMYDDSVLFYGHHFSKAMVLAAKRRALRPGAQFHQQIVGPIDVVPLDGGLFMAKFLKQSGPPGQMREVRAEITLKRNAKGELAIVDETDAGAQKLRGAEATSECQVAIKRVVSNMPGVLARGAEEVRRFAESHGPGASLDSPFPLVSGGDGDLEGCDVFVQDFVVYPATCVDLDPAGRLTVTTGNGDDVPVPPEGLAEVARACARDALSRDQ